VQELDASPRGQSVCANLVVKLEDVGLTTLDIVNMQVKYLSEAGPQDVDGDLLEDAVEDSQPVDPLHLALALLVNLDHDSAGVGVEQGALAEVSQFLNVVFADDLSEDLVEHVGLLGFVRDVEIKELQDEQELLGNSI